MNLNLYSGSPEETFFFGKSLANVLTGSELIFLRGNLGAGKTIFTKGMGYGLGIDTREIVSPSYTLMNIYEGRCKLFHIDLYRIGEQINRGIPEIDDNLDAGIIAVEWADYIKEYYQGEKNLIDIFISFKGGNDPGRILSIVSGLTISPGTFSKT